MGGVTIAYASRFLNKAEEKYSINELELLGIVWALEHFKHFLLGHKFTVQTDHRALLSILKERSSKIHQSRLTRWCDRLIPFTFTIEHIPGSKMGKADYMARNPDQIASPPNTYDADFIIAQINVIKDTLNIIRKHDIITQHAQYAAQQNTIKPSHDYNNRTTTGMESQHEYRKLKKFMESSHDSKQSNIGIKSPHDSTTINSKAQKAWHNNKPSLQNEQFCETSRTKINYSNNYSLRSKHKKASEHIPNTEYDVTQDKIVSNDTINKAHLPISLSPTQQHLQNYI